MLVRSKEQVELIDRTGLEEICEATKPSCVECHQAAVRIQPNYLKGPFLWQNTAYRDGGEGLEVDPRCKPITQSTSICRRCAIQYCEVAVVTAWQEMA